MGRYYSGDIEGKFWFALQSSNAASRFGGVEVEPAYLNYYFDEDHLEEVEAEIKNIQDSLEDKIQILDDFFKENNGYTDVSINKLGISMDELRDYADLGLGIKIRDQIKNFGTCSFDAEL